jgi:hypothetical protein
VRTPANSNIIFLGHAFEVLVGGGGEYELAAPFGYEAEVRIEPCRVLGLVHQLAIDDKRPPVRQWVRDP